MLQSQCCLAMRKSLNNKQIGNFVCRLLLFIFAIIIHSVVGQIDNLKIPHVRDRDLIFWLIEVNER